MAERFSYDFGHESDDDSEDGTAKKRADRPAFELPKRPLPRVEKSQGDAREFHRDFLKPLDTEKLKSPEQENRDEPGVETHIAPEPDRLEREHSWRQTSPEELAGMAARQVQATHYLHELETEKSEEADDDEEDEDEKKQARTGDAAKPAAVRLDKESAVPEAAGKTDAVERTEPAPSESSDAETSESMMLQNAPEFAKATSGDALGEPPSDSIEARLTQTDAGFDKLMHDHDGPPDMSEAPATPVAVAATERPSDDEIFRYMAEQTTGEDPGPANFREQALGEPPIETGDGGANLPPNLPTAEGARDGGGREPWEMPAGGLADAANVAGLTVLGARQELNSLKHTAREAGLAGAVGILGLGLVLEHFRVSRLKRRERKLERQVKNQGRVLNETSRSLQREQTAHQATGTRLEHLSAAQATAGEQLRRTAERPLASAESAVGAGLISAATAAELARRTGNKVAAQPVNQRELAQQLEHDRVLGRAIQRNPELRDTAVNSGAAIGEGNHELRELVGASAYGEVLRRERNYEQVQKQTAQTAARADETDGASAPILPSLQSAGMAQTSVGQPNAQADIKPERHSSAAKSATLATILVIAVIILIIAFTRR